ncbi:MAG: hypothetical protein HWN81_10180 [Candidatus Lokiarchaeota archaeon]|nr:hypothetical protein [Candidatus Lokiarchaeota archaeon]
MRIYFTLTNNPKIIGIAQAIEKLINEAFFVDFKKQNIFDFIEVSKPDLLFINSTDLNNTYIDYVRKENPNLKLCLIKEQFTDPNIDKLFDYTINTFNKTLDNYLPYLHNDNIITNEGIFENKFESDFTFISNIQNQSLDLVKGLDLIGDNFNLKIFGKYKIKSPYYIGNVTESDYKHIFKSTKGLISLNDEWDMSCIASNIVPISFNMSDKKDYQWSNIEELFNVCKEIFSGNQFKIDGTFNTYKNYAKTIIEEMKL